MTDLTKRLITSIFLISLFALSFFYNAILLVVLFFCINQIFYEFYFILKKITTKHAVGTLYFLLFFFLIFITSLICHIGLTLYFDNLFNKIFLLLTISITISSDIGGFIFGKIFKGKKISKISPNKTYSGMFGSYLLSVIINYSLFKNFFPEINIILFAIIISSMSQFGDFFFSFLKRKAKLKDTANILPGHGGLLDRFDGIIFSIPTGLLIKLFI